jgi:hypothetical protein
MQTSGGQAGRHSPRLPQLGDSSLLTWQPHLFTKSHLVNLLTSLYTASINLPGKYMEFLSSSNPLMSFLTSWGPSSGSYMQKPCKRRDQCKTSMCKSRRDVLSVARVSPDSDQYGCQKRRKEGEEEDNEGESLARCWFCKPWLAKDRFAANHSSSQASGRERRRHQSMPPFWPPP